MCTYGKQSGRHQTTAESAIEALDAGILKHEDQLIVLIELPGNILPGPGVKVGVNQGRMISSSGEAIAVFNVVPQLVVHFIDLNGDLVQAISVVHEADDFLGVNAQQFRQIGPFEHDRIGQSVKGVVALSGAKCHHRSG